ERHEQVQVHVAKACASRHWATVTTRPGIQEWQCAMPGMGLIDTCNGAFCPTVIQPWPRALTAHKSRSSAPAQRGSYSAVSPSTAESTPSFTSGNLADTSSAVNAQESSSKVPLTF